MKILLLLSGLLFAGRLFADMDIVCYAAGNDTNKVLKSVKDRCERNNIFVWVGMDEPNLNLNIARWCRMDREIKYHRRDVLNTYDLTCVLYSNKPRVVSFS